MTHAAPRRRANMSWRIPVVVLIGIAIAAFVGVLSRSIFIDFLSWWPVWLILGVSSFFGRNHKIGQVRLSGLLAIGSVVVLGAFLWGHLQGWPLFPSSADGLVGGPDTAIAVAAMSVGVDGELSVAAGTPGLIYEVESIRRGGEVGLPSATERVQEDTVSIEVNPLEAAGWYQFAGWTVSLSPTPTWSLSLRGQLDVDLTELVIDNLQIEGGGTVSLGPAAVGTPVTLSGDFLIEVPASQPVRVIGPAEIPEDWIRNESGAAAPDEGQGWVISIPEGSVVEIQYR